MNNFIKKLLDVLNTRFFPCKISLGLTLVALTGSDLLGSHLLSPWLSPWLSGLSLALTLSSSLALTPVALLALTRSHSPASHWLALSWLALALTGSHAHGSHWLSVITLVGLTGSELVAFTGCLALNLVASLALTLFHS